MQNTEQVTSNSQQVTSDGRSFDVWDLIEFVQSTILWTGPVWLRISPRGQHDSIDKVSINIPDRCG